MQSLSSLRQGNSLLTTTQIADFQPPAIMGKNRGGGSKSQPIGAQNSPATLQSLTSELESYEREIIRETFPIDQLKVAGDQLIAGDRTYRLNEDGSKNLCQRIGAPHDYLQRLPAPLREILFGHHFQTRAYPDRKLTRKNSAIISRNGRLLDLDRTDLFRLTGADALGALCNGVGADAASLEVHRMTLADESIAVELLSPKFSEEVRRGDLIRAGLRMEHCFVGQQATVVTTFVYRLACENGLIHRDCLNRRRSPRTRRIDAAHPQARELQIAQIRQLTAATWTGLHGQIENIRRLQDEQVSPEQVPIILDQFVRRSRLHSHRLMQLVQSAWNADGSEPTAFGMLNALTWVASHSTELTLRQRRLLLQLAGVFANRRTHICPRCFSVIHDRT